MKNLKKTVLATAAVLALGATSVTALAASYSTPAELLANLTGKSVESIIAERVEEHTTYGALAGEYGVLDGYKDQMLEQKRIYLEERVEAGTMTDEKATAIMDALETRMETCDGTGSGGVGAGLGAGFGMGGAGNSGEGARNGNGDGTCGGVCDGTGTGAGLNQGVRGGVCDGTGTGTGLGQGVRGGGRGGRGA